MCYLPSVRSRWLGTDQVLFFCAFMDLDFVKVHKKEKKKKKKNEANIQPSPAIKLGQ